MSATLDLRNKQSSVSFDETKPEIPTISVTRPRGDSSTAIATTEFVQDAITHGSDVLSVFGRTGVVVAQSGDYNVAEVTGAAPLDSPIFINNPQAPTPLLSDDSTTIPTTHYVKGQTWAQSSITGLVVALAACEKTANKNQPSGYAGLDVSGLLNTAQIPAPTSTTFGGVKSLAAVAHNFLTSIGTDGVPVAAQPSSADLSDVANIAFLNVASQTLTGPLSVRDDNIGSSGTVFTSGLFVNNTTASTNSQQQDPPALEFDGTYWNGAASAAGSVIVWPHFGQSGGTINSSNMTFLFSGHPNSVSALVIFKNGVLTATASQNVPVPSFAFVGSFWNGSAAAQETWEFQHLMGTGTNPTSTFQLIHVGSSGTATIDLANSGGSGTALVVKVPTATPLTNSTVAASSAYADAAVAVETSRAQTAEALKAPLLSPTFTGTPASTTPSATDNSTRIETTAGVASLIVDGTPAANTLVKRVAVRQLLNTSSVDGSASAATLYTVPVGDAGIYRTHAFAVPRTKSSSAWVVNVDVTWPSGTNFPVSALMGLNMQTPAAPAGNQGGVAMYLHDGDVISCGTATGSGSNTGGAFDVIWTVERIN